MSSSLRSYVNDFVRQKKFKGFSDQVISETKRSGTRFSKDSQDLENLAGADTSNLPQQLRPASAGRSFFQTRNQ
ncbi:hypothetical protein [Pseudomonas fluorescens]|uniref:hypothetical protein n=1 Tax=Pseudomonas fluorescens TaxID=294 RepID=UPI00126987E8|nr:hypothetical protein [Pseudomonas fluorescens]